MQIRKSYPASCIDKKAPQKHPPQKTSNKEAHSPEANEEEALYRAYREFGAQFAPFYSMPLALDNFTQSFFLYIIRFFLYNPCCTKRQLRNLNKVYSPANISVHAYILSLISHVQLCVTLWTVACQVLLSMGFSWQEYWSGLLCPPPGSLPDLGNESAFLMTSAVAGKFLNTSATCEALILFYQG